MFTDEEKQLMEATTEFTRKDSQTKSVFQKPVIKLTLKLLP